MRTGKFRDQECISLFILLVLDKIANNCAGEIRGKNNMMIDYFLH